MVIERIFKKAFTLIKLLNQVNGLKTIFYNLRITHHLFGGLFIGFNSIIRINNKSEISIKGSLFVNNSWFKKRYRVSKGVLITEEYAKLRVIGNFSMYDGSTIYVAKNATLELGDGSFINTGSDIECHLYISIGNNCYISDHVNIQDSDIHTVIENGEKRMNAKPIIIGDNVWIGKNSLILKGVTIGTGSVIAAGSIVTKDVASNCMVAGNPARIIKRNIRWE